MAKLVKLYRSDGSSFNEEYYVATDWSIINNKPTNFTPTEHSHNITEIEDVNYTIENVPKVTRALFDVLRADRTAFLPASQIIIEESIDGGVTWSDAGVSDTDKRKLFTGERPSIRIPLKNGVKSTDCMLRITITAMRYNVPDGTAEVDKYNYWNSNYVLSAERYCSLDEGWVWLFSVADSVYCKIEKATGLNPTSWILDREAYMKGWSGGNYFSLSGNAFGGGTTQTGNAWNWRLTFRTCTSEYTFDDSKLDTTYSTTSQLIYHIKLSGKNVWSYSNNYMYHDHIYSWDENQNTYFPNKVYTANGVLEAVTKNSSNNSLDEPLNLKYGQWYEDDINAYGLNCNNSDIIDANGIYFADSTDSPGEGINFINSNDSTKYDTIYTYNNKLYFHSLRTRGEGLSGSLVLTSEDAYTKTQVDNKVDNKVFLKFNTDNRAVATIPNEYVGQFELKGLKSNSVLGLSESSEGDYSGLLGMRSWGDSSGGNAHEFAFTGNGNIFHRHGATTTWNSWRKIAYKDEIPIVPTWALKPSLDIDDIPTIPHTKLSGVINYQNLDAILSDYRTAVVADNLYATKDELNNRAPIEIKGTYNLNNLLSVGFYTINGNMNVTNAPVTGAYSVIVTRSANGNYFHQMIMQDSTHNVYVRYYNGSTWSEWRKLLYDDEKAYDTTRVDGIEVKYYTQSQFASITPVAGVHYVIYEN